MSVVVDPRLVRQVVVGALAEDFGVDAGALEGPHAIEILARDVTTHRVVPPGARFSGLVRARGEGVVCGVDVAACAWETLAFAAGCADSLTVERLAADGDRVAPRDAVASVSGRADVVLGAERSALNALMVLSGIATESARWHAAAGGAVVVLDTRKSYPGLRVLTKWAVGVGGSTPHRAGLWDMALIKDNHIRLAGGVTAAVEAVKRPGASITIEVEADRLEHALEAVVAGADIVLLDNMNTGELATVVRAVRACAESHNRSVLLEASGAIRIEDLGAVIASGVDRVSTSALAFGRPIDFALDDAGEL